MPLIELITFISAPIGVCFDLARSVDMHTGSFAHTNERVIAGRSSGLCEAGDEITWEAVHLGIRQRLSVRITEMNRPYSFTDEMTKGVFHSLRHRHLFKEKEDGTLMTDIFRYRSPLGILGKIADALFLQHYMTSLLLRRNAHIKATAESLRSQPAI